jgi:hypothetical protein
MTPQKFTRWASTRGLPRQIIQQLIQLAASPEEMKEAFDAVEPAPPIYTLADIVEMTDEDPYGISPSANGLMIVGGCPNGDPIAVDVADEPGSVWYVSHEDMSEGPVREAAIRVAKDPAALMEGIANDRKFPLDYYAAKARRRPSKK